MTIGKFPFFLLLFFLIGIPMGDQLQQTYDYMYFPSGGEKIWVRVPSGTGFQPGAPVSLRYLLPDRTNGRVNSLIGLWGDILVYEGIPELMLLVCFLHPDVAPWGSKLRLSRRRPFVYICS